MLRQLPEDRFCTAACVRLEPQDGSVGVGVDVSRAGHPPPLLVRSGATVEEVGCSGKVLGVFPDAELRDTSLRLMPGEALVLYTDGVTEARSPDGDFFGEGRLRRLLSSCAGRGCELDGPDQGRKTRLEQGARYDGAEAAGDAEAGTEKAEVGAPEPRRRELGGQRSAGDLEDHLGQREEQDEGDEYADERIAQEERRRRSREEGGTGEQGDDPGSTVDQVRDGELEQYYHEPVGPKEEPYLPVRHPDEVLRVDRQGLPVLGKDIVEQNPYAEQYQERPVRERSA